MKRKLVAALACRINGTRLYGKPLQNLDKDVTILSQIIAALRSFQIFDELILGISDERANYVFIDIAKDLGLRYVMGDPKDVLSRLIACGRLGGATDIFRITTECPFFDYSKLEEAWKSHVRLSNDITVLDHVPEGAGFEIYSQDALEISHRDGLESDRSEFCSNYARFNQKLFKIQILKPDPKCQRLDLRLTVDYPEDLILCRAVYKTFSNLAPLIPLQKIIEYLDTHPELKQLVEPFVATDPVWYGLEQRQT